MAPMPLMKRLAIFCASRPGADPALVDAAHEVGAWLAQHEIGVVYGGGGSGLMGAVASGALERGGEVIGVIPEDMINREWGRHDLTELHVVDTMHERKALMAKYADAFLCLPGGLGTLEEIFEAWTWRTLGYSDGPVGFLNVGGFWDQLLVALDGLVDAEYVSHSVRDDLVVATSIEDAVAGLDARLGDSPAR